MFRQRQQDRSSGSLSCNSKQHCFVALLFSRSEPICSKLPNRSIRRQISILQVNEHRHSIQRPWKQLYRDFVKNRPRFKKSIRIDQKIDKSIDSARSLDGKDKKRNQATSVRITSFHLSPTSKIMKIGSGSAEKRLVEKSVTDRRTEGRTEGHDGFCTPISKANSLRSLRSLRE